MVFIKERVCYSWVPGEVACHVIGNCTRKRGWSQAERGQLWPRAFTVVSTGRTGRASLEWADLNHFSVLWDTGCPLSSTWRGCGGGGSGQMESSSECEILMKEAGRCGPWSGLICISKACSAPGCLVYLLDRGNG